MNDTAARDDNWLQPVHEVIIHLHLRSAVPAARATTASVPSHRPCSRCLTPATGSRTTVDVGIRNTPAAPTRGLAERSEPFVPRPCSWSLAQHPLSHRLNLIHLVL